MVAEVTEAAAPAAPPADIVADAELTPEALPAETVLVEAAEPAQVAETTANEALPEPVSPLDPFATLSDDDLLAHERVQGLVERRAEAARQREADRIRRDEGKAERVRERLNPVLEAWGVEPETVGPHGRQQAELLFEQAHSYALYDVLSATAESALAALAPGDAERDALKGKLEALATPQDLHAFAGQLMEQYGQGRDSAGYERGIAEGRKELETKIADERKAWELEAQPKREAPPNAPAGNPVGTDALPISSMSDADAAFNSDRITHAQYKAYREQFGLSAAPGGR